MWYYALNDQQTGPISKAELQQKLQSELTPDTMVWKDGMAAWTKAGEVAELQQPTPVNPAAQQAMPGMSPVTDSENDNPYAAPLAAGISTPGINGFNEIPAEPIKLDIGFCISQGWKYTTANFGNVFLVWFIYIVILFVTELILGGIGSAIDGPQPGVITDFEGMDSSEAFLIGMQQADQTGTVGTLLGYVSQVFQIFLGMGMFAFSLSLVRGQETNISQLFSQSGGKLLKVLGATILYYIMVIVGCLFLIVPGIYLALRFMHYQAAIVDKDLGVIESLKYSSQLTRDNKLNLFGLGILCGLIALAGFIAIFVGLLWAIPTVWLASTIAYCYLHSGEQSIVVID